jgi:hypothetical protein
MIPTKVSDKDAGLETKRASYIDMIQKHGTIQLSMGSANINGLINFAKKFSLHRTNEDGTPAATIRKVVQSVLRYETLDRDNIWLAEIPRDNGAVTGYFTSLLPETRTYIEEWTQCPASQIYWFLIRKGCKIEHV